MPFMLEQNTTRQVKISMTTQCALHYKLIELTSLNLQIEKEFHNEETIFK